MSHRAVGIVLVTAVLAASSATLGAGPIATDQVELIQTPHCVVVGLRDIDLVKQAYPDLRGEIALLDAAGATIDTFRVDYAHAATPSHIPLLKREGRDYRAVHLILRAGGKVVLDSTMDLPPAVAAGSGVPLLDETAALEKGSGFDPAAAPKIRLPDYNNVRTVDLNKPKRSVDLMATKIRVTSDFNFPMAANTIFVARRTHSDDPKEYSFYVPMKNNLYDVKTGAQKSAMKYLAEVPIDPAWFGNAEDQVVNVPAAAVRIHMTTDTLKVWRLGKPRITGNREGLLGQCIHSRAQDDDQNIYFAMAYRSPIRFNIAKAKWEAPPVNIYEFLDGHKPKREDLPYPKRLVGPYVRTDFSNVILYHNGRIFVAPTRYLITGMGAARKSQLMVPFVCSIPVADWDDPAAFKEKMRVNAVAYPGTPISLWDTHLDPKDHQRKLNVMVAYGNRVCMMAYHSNYFWVMDLAEDGSTKKLVRIDAVDGKKIVKFNPLISWLLGINDKNRWEVIGAHVKATLEGDAKPRELFLPNGAYAFTTDLPKRMNRQPGHFAQRHDVYTGGAYGGITRYKADISGLMGLPGVGGMLTVRYDAISRLMTDPGVPKDVLAEMSAASMGPEYYAVGIPGEGAKLLGTADYPRYYFGVYDCPKGATATKRDFLLSAMGGAEGVQGVSAAMALYCHRWLREGKDDVLHYAGYTGVARMVYRRNGVVPARHTVEKLFHGQAKHLPLDGARNDYIKWYHDMLPGLGDKLFLTGVNMAQRGGGAFSGGLMFYHTRSPDHLYKLSYMSRANKTTALAGRLFGRPGGALEMAIYLRGNFDESDALTIPEAQRPTNHQPSLFVYEDRGADEVKDLYGFTLAAADTKGFFVKDVAVSQNGLYVVLLMKNSVLLTFDPDGHRFVDAVRLPRPLYSLSYMRLGRRLMVLPDGSLMICVSAAADSKAGKNARAASATFARLNIDATGAISLEVACTFPNPSDIAGPMALLPDMEKKDGSYDLAIGSREAAVKIVRDFLPPRALQGVPPASK